MHFFLTEIQGVPGAKPSRDRSLHHAGEGAEDRHQPACGGHLHRGPGVHLHPGPLEVVEYREGPTFGT